MVFILALLGSMIVCGALFCGGLQRACESAAREMRRHQERVSSLIAASNTRAIGGDYRWE